MAEFRAKLGRVLEEESIKTDEVMASHTTFRLALIHIYCWTV